MSFEFVTASGDEDAVDRDDVYARVLRTLRLFHEGIPDNNTSGPKSWFVPVNPHSLSEWPEDYKGRYLSWLREVADDEEYNSVRFTIHASGPTRPVRREDFRDPSLHKYLMGDFVRSSLICWRNTSEPKVTSWR